jgi:hypothetical protein
MKKIIQYDISRGRIPLLETVFKHVEILKDYGLTGVCFYIECVAENAVFPACGCGKTPVTHEYLSKIRSYLDKLGMEFIPIIQVLGHQEHLLEYPEMERHRECSAKSSSFRIDSPETRNAIKKWLAELIPFFNSDYVHVGGDEAFTVGLGRSRDFILKHGFEEAIADYFNQIHGFLVSKGKNMVMYADLIIHYPKIRELIHKDIVICNWGYGTWTEIYEQENHNFSMHEYVTEGRKNWVTGNSMAEYITIPFKRLERNTSVWIDLGGRSKSGCFIISDWGSYENINPFFLSIIGDIYILKRLENHGFLLDDFLDELSSLIIGCDNADFKKALRIMLLAQNNPDYFGVKLKDWSPVFPAIFADDPDSRSVIRTCVCFEKEGLIKFENDTRMAVHLLDSISHINIPNPDMFHDICALSRRLLVLALRTRLCFDHAWDSGAIWLEKKDFAEKEKRLSEYMDLARQDLEWHMGKWDSDNMESCREKSRKYLEDAMNSTSKTVHITDNAMLHFPPK